MHAVATRLAPYRNGTRAVRGWRRDEGAGDGAQ